MGREEYKISNDKKMKFATLYMLNYMINTPKKIDVMLDGNDEDLESILEFMMSKDLIKIDGAYYIPTEKGREQLRVFLKRYQDYLRNYDVYCAVDLGEGEFAFSYIDDYGEDFEAWSKFLDDERWEDLRIAVAEFKKIDPVEIVFMSFVNEGFYGKSEEGWQFDLLLGSVWDDIIDICNNALHVEDLSWEDDEGFVSGEDVIKDVLVGGAKLNEKLAQDIKDDEEYMDCETYGEDPDDDIERERVEVITTEVYESYHDPFYISPVWLVALFIF
ncbi:MAG: hypothetical protein CR982_02380 [Candidatus Cloacimonadota bacterium]|nr:MAG: hypothetical protein CR982_02380 [Candidatus Cloacimonadota bacterium]PIE78550.1 MAG: hypothetical protein CSA15_07600 [Candidatus Delongbacteria bacterium]